MNDTDLASMVAWNIEAASDWLEEQGRTEEARGLRSGEILPEMRGGYGSGSGGYGYGSGGYGYGYGYDYGGYGIGYGGTKGGDHNTILALEALEVNDLEIGRTYLWMSGDGWMWRGTFIRRDGMFGAVIGAPVNVCRTGGASWSDLCRGVGREGMRTESYADLWPNGMPLLWAQPHGVWRPDGR